MHVILLFCVGFPGLNLQCASPAIPTPQLFGSSWERELFAADLPLPPFAAATCAALVGRCQQLQVGCVGE